MAFYIVVSYEYTLYCILACNYWGLGVVICIWKNENMQEKTTIITFILSTGSSLGGDEENWEYAISRNNNILQDMISGDPKTRGMGAVDN